MKEELLRLQQEMKELRDLFQNILQQKPLDESTLKGIFEEYFRNKEMLTELRFIKIAIITAISIGVFSLGMLLYLAE